MHVGGVCRAAAHPLFPYQPRGRGGGEFGIAPADDLRLLASTMPPALPSTPPALTRGVRAGMVALLGVLALAYARTVSAPFVFDDYGSIVGNRTIRHLGALRHVLSPPHAAGATVGGRPVLNLTLALDYALSGEAVWSYHVTNWLIHAGCALLLFGVLWRMLPARPSAPPAVLALAVTAVWALHPLQTESVTYVSQRAEALGGFFYLLTLYAFLRATDAPRDPAPLLETRRPRRVGFAEAEDTAAAAPAGHRGWLAMSVAACALGVCAKEIVGTAPLLILLWDRLAVAGSFRAAWRCRRGYYAGLFASWAILAALIATTENRGGTAGLGTPVSSWSYLLTQSQAIVHYLRLVVWPSPLVFDYGSSLASGFAAVWPFFVGLALAFVLVLTALRRWARAAFVGLAFFVLLAPSSSFVPIASQTLAEHRMYLPLAAVLTAALLAFQTWLGRTALALFFVTAAICAAVTWQRNEVYRSPVALWSQALAAVPDNARAHNDLGNALVSAGDLPAALAHFQTACALQPAYADAESNLGHTLGRLGRAPEALSHLEKAARLNPRSPEILTNLGIALAGTGRYADAVAVYQRALTLAPESVDARYDMGNALYQARDYAGAAATYEALLATVPRHHDARFNFAFTLLQLGRPQDALHQFEQVIARYPDDADAHAEAGNILAQLGQTADAIGHFETALRLKPDFPAVQTRLAAARATLAGRAK